MSVACQMQSVVQKESEPAREMKRREGAGQKPRNDSTNFQVVCVPLLRERGEKEKKSRCLLIGLTSSFVRLPMAVRSMAAAEGSSSDVNVSR